MGLDRQPPAHWGRHRSGRLLTPIIAAGPGLTPGLLVSGTTRRPGVVANYDIAPSVLSWLDLPTPGGLPGHCLPPAANCPGFSNSGAGTDELLEARLSYLEDLLTRSAATYRQLPCLRPLLLWKSLFT